MSEERARLVVTMETTCVGGGGRYCVHPYGEHYESYDGKKRGCSHYDDNQRDGGPCFCKGFALGVSGSVTVEFPT